MKVSPEKKTLLDRRSFLKSGVLAAGALAAGPALSGSNSSLAASAARSALPDNHGKKPSTFHHACTTLAYRHFPLERSLSGIKNAGYDYVVWGTQHREADGENHPVMAPDAPPEKAAELARRCRDHGLEPAQMFSTVYPDHDDAVNLLNQRILQASAAGMEQVLIFGPTSGGDPDLWVKRFKQLGPIAADNNVTLVLKQHGGETTGTGAALKKIISEIDHPNVWMSYDAGNVFWYLDIDPIPDIESCADQIRAFCMKDYRSWPTRTTGGPGYGEIDHYRLMAPVAFTGQTITLAYENITPAYNGAPTNPAQVDRWARLSREYMENIITALQRT